MPTPMLILTPILILTLTLIPPRNFLPLPQVPISSSEFCHVGIVKVINTLPIVRTHYIQTIQIHLIQTHATILAWFEAGDELKHYRPADGGWTVIEVLEHIALTSHFLLKLINKGTEKALRNTKELNLEVLLAQFDYDLSRINRIGEHKSFAWIRPEHMEPTGVKSELEIKRELIDQLNTCLMQMERLARGEG